MTDWKLRLTVLALLLVALLSACGGQAATPEVKRFDGTIRIGAANWPGYGAFYIADARGLFKAEGVDVQLVAYPSNSDEDFIARKLEGNLTSLANVVSQKAFGFGVSVPYFVDYSDGGDVFIARSDITNIGKMRGKPIGLVLGTSSEVFVSYAFRSYGMKMNEVTLVNVPIDQVPQALADGTIVAGHTREPYLTEALAAGNHIVFSTANTPSAVVDVFTMTTDFVQEYPEDVKAILRAVLAAQTWWDANPADGNAIVGNVVGMTREQIAGMISGIHIYGLKGNSNPKVVQTIFASGDLAVDLLSKRGIIKNPVDVRDIIDLSLIQSLASS